MGRIGVLHVGGPQTELPIARFDVQSQMAVGRPAELVVLRGQEVHQVGVIGTSAPAPALGELQIETDTHLIRGLEQASDRR